MADNKFSLFGFTISRKKAEEDALTQQSFAPPSNDDGALTITSAAYYGTYVDLDGTAKNEVLNKVSALMEKARLDSLEKGKNLK